MILPDCIVNVISTVVIPWVEAMHNNRDSISIGFDSSNKDLRIELIAPQEDHQTEISMLA